MEEQPNRGRPLVRRGRGPDRGRGRGRGQRGMRAVDIQQQQDQRRRERQQRIRVMVDNKDEEVRGLLRNLADRQPGLLLDIWELQPQAKGPGHRLQPHWCTCGRCQDIPLVEEEVCCMGGQDNCLSEEPAMDALVLDPGVLDIALRIINDMFGAQANPEPNRSTRHAAYRQFIMWQYGRMGQGNREVIPSCVVTRIRTTYPSPNGHYTGFRPARLV